MCKSILKQYQQITAQAKRILGVLVLCVVSTAVSMEQEQNSLPEDSFLSCITACTPSIGSDSVVVPHELRNEIAKKVDGSAHWWYVASKLKCNAPVKQVEFSPDANLFAMGAGYCAQIFDVKTGQNIQNLRHQSCVKTVAFSPDGTLFATGDGDYYGSIGCARIFNVKTGQELQAFSHNGSVDVLAFSPNSTSLATGGTCSAQIFDTETGKKYRKFKHGSLVSQIAFSSDGTLFATKCEDNYARIFDVKTGQVIQNLRHSSPVNSVAFSPDGKLLVTGTAYCAQIFDTETGQNVQALPNSSWVRGVAFSPDGSSIATGCGDGFSAIWSWYKNPTLEQILCKRVLLLWLQAKKQDKTIHSIDSLFDSVAEQFSVERNQHTIKLGVTKEMLKAIYNTFPEKMQTALWEKMRGMIMTYGKDN